MRILILALLSWSAFAAAEPRKVDEYHWAGVERIVAIGDLHGDYEHYLATLEAAGLVDRRGRWAGGEAHLVQTGDIADRGPDTIRIMEHIDKLARDARKKGGAVHRLIGNHEAMNVYGDLRYVSPGEFEAFADRNSDTIRDRYFDLVMQDLEQRDPDAFAALAPDFREQWDKEHPLGWVEHRQAWDPRWNPEGEFVSRTQDLKVAVQVNDLIFIHGGISGYYCQNSLESLTEMVISRLHTIDPADMGPLEDEFGPLWYRGLSGGKPEATPETVQSILDHHDAGHIVVGHTPTSGVIWPSYDQRVIQIDTGIGAAYGGHVAFLEVTSDGLFAGYPGGRIPLPASDEERVDYLRAVMELNPGNPYLEKRLAALTAPAEERETGFQADDTAAEDDTASEEGGPNDSAPTPAPIPTCGSR